jgi:surface antigen
VYSLGVSRSRVVALVIAVLTASVLSAAPSTAATTSATLCTHVAACKKAGYSDAGYDAAKGRMYWNMFSGANCTNYVAYRLITHQGLPRTRPWSGSGNAKNWGTALPTYRTSTPVPGAVAWWPYQGSAGHVAYVEKVDSKSITISESSWGGPVLRWRRIARTDAARWPTDFLVLSLPAVAKPTVSGTVKVGGAVSTAAVKLDPSVKADQITYRWQADGKSISGAGTRTYTPTEAELGKSLAVRVVVKRGTLETSTLYSAAAKVLPGALATTTARPTYSGTKLVDRTVKASPGTWNVSGTTFRYQWMSDGKPIPGATSASLTIPGSVAGTSLSVSVTASRSGYQPTTLSSPTVAVPFSELTVTTPPRLRGRLAVGSRLSLSDDAFSRTDVERRYQWFADGVAIRGATSETFTPTPGFLGKRLSVQVTASRSGYRDAVATTAASNPLPAGAMTSGNPVLRGTPAVGRDLAVNTPRWASGARYQYQWYAEGSAIRGATSSRLTLTPQLATKRIRVRVTATAPGYQSTARTSAWTARVARGTVSASVAVKGTATVRGKLKATVTVRRPATGTRTLRYQWLRDGKVIRGATGSTYRVATADRRHRLSVRVTVSASGYTTRAVTSGRTGTVR